MSLLFFDFTFFIEYNKDMKKEESKADCVAKISWHLDAKEETEIDFEQSVCDISGLYFSDQQEDLEVYSSFERAAYNINKIPLNEFEKYAKEIPDKWLDEDARIVFSAKFDQRKESEKC